MMGIRFGRCYFFAAGSFVAGGVAAGLGENRFASGLRVLQSVGGNETRQNRGVMELLQKAGITERLPEWRKIAEAAQMNQGQLVS
jgi:hypothetical protein